MTSVDTGARPVRTSPACVENNKVTLFAEGFAAPSLQVRPDPNHVKLAPTL